MTLTTAGKNWLATNAGANGCLAPSGVSFTDGDGVPFTMGTKDVVIAFIGANLGNKKDAIIIANTSYNGFVAINGQGLTYPDATWVYNNDGHTEATPIYCAPAAHVISATLTVDKTDCTAPCTVGGTVSWTNSGDIPSVPMNLQVTVNGGTPTTVATGLVINPGVTTTVYPFSLPDLPVGTYEICASPDSGTTCKTVIVSPTPSNVISATLTVDPIDCVEPCTVNGTVSWTNTGGTASIPIDLQVTVNGGTPTTVATGLVINPGETTPVYEFSLPDLAEGTYEICASPDSGTTCKTVTVRTPADVMSATLDVDKTDCTTPCTVGITVSWKNNGGTTSEPMDLGITVNGTLTTLASGITISPGGTTTTYSFSLSDLSSGTYEICASPDSGTTCKTVTVTTPANIVATSITLVPDVTTCLAPCSFTDVSITWTNNGGTSADFTPTMILDGTPTSSALEPLGAGATTTRSWTASNLLAGSHTICADPNPTALACKTITVNASASFTSTPSGSTVYIDGSETSAGTTPVTVPNLSVGTHTYRLTNTGCDNEATGEFVIAVGANIVDVPVTFDTSARFESVPAHARIWVDDIDTGIDTPGNVTGLTVGDHTYKLKKPGYLDVEGPFTTILCQRVNIPANLSKLEEAGMGGIMMAGLLFGALLFGVKKEEKKQPSAAKQKSAQVSRSNITNN